MPRDLDARQGGVYGGCGVRTKKEQKVGLSGRDRFLVELLLQSLNDEAQEPERTPLMLQHSRAPSDRMRIRRMLEGLLPDRPTVPHRLGNSVRELREPRPVAVLTSGVVPVGLVAVGRLGLA